MNVANLVALCLENEGVAYISGLPGEEIIPLVDALNDTSIRFILTRSEQAAAFMADMYGRVTGKAGVCLPPSVPEPSIYCSEWRTPKRTAPPWWPSAPRWAWAGSTKRLIRRWTW